MTIVQEQEILKAASNLFLTTDSLQALTYTLNLPFHHCMAYNLKFL